MSSDKRLLIGADSNGIARPLRVDASGRLEVVRFGSDVNARVYNNADISLSDAALTGLTFNTELTDVYGMHSTSSNPGRLTCQVAGNYLIGGCVQFGMHATGRRYLAVRLNGSWTLQLVQVAAVSSTFGVVLSVETFYPLAAGDYVELMAYQDSGGSLNAVYAAVYSPLFWAVMV